MIASLLRDILLVVVAFVLHFKDVLLGCSVDIFVFLIILDLEFKVSVM